MTGELQLDTGGRWWVLFKSETFPGAITERVLDLNTLTAYSELDKFPLTGLELQVSSVGRFQDGRDGSWVTIGEVVEINRIDNLDSILHRLEPIIKAMASKVAGLPTEAASTAEVVAASEHVIDTLIEALDGLEIDGNVATGDDARRLIAELIGATIP